MKKDFDTELALELNPVGTRAVLSNICAGYWASRMGSRTSTRVLLALFALGIFSAFAPLAHAAFDMPQNNLGLVGWWTMDYYTGASTLMDSSGGGNNGIMVNNPTKVAGKIGQALSFNGTSQYVNLGTSPTLNPKVFTISAWVQPIGSGVRAIFGGIGTGNIEFRIESAQDLGLIKQGIVAVGYSTGTVNNGVWQQISVTYDSSGNYIFYINGKDVGGGTNSQTFSPTGDSCIGLGFSTREGFNGSIDDVRIYNRVLSASEVKTLYQSSLPAHIASSINTPDLTKGLIGWWTFDGNDISGTSVYDKSGNGYTGTKVNSPAQVAGVLGQALSFDGVSNQYVDLGKPPSFSFGDVTVSLWAKTTKADSNLMLQLQDNAAGALIYFGVGAEPVGGAISGQFNVLLRNDSWNLMGPFNSGVVVDNNKWYLLTMTRSNTTGVVTLYVNGVETASYTGYTGLISTNTGTSINWLSNANNPTDYYKGSLDDVRIYNRVLSASEVQQLYDLGKQSHVASTVNPSGLSSGLVGHWSFDGANLTATTAYDTSGQINNGTLINSPKPVAGVIGQALSFNGTSQYVNLGSPADLNLSATTGKFTLSAWVYPTANPLGPGVITEMYYPNNTTVEYEIGYGLTTCGTNYLAVGFYQTSPGWTTAVGSSPVLNTWQFITGTFDGTTLRLYLNGQQVATDVPGVAMPSSGYYQNVTIGRRHDAACGVNYFPGKIDDPRIYNRALSASEVQQLYNLGH